MAALTALFGTAIVFTGAYLVEKTPRFRQVRGFVQFLALLPLAVPGLVLGLGYIFFFNNPSNPLRFIYGTMAILVVCTIVALLLGGAPDRGDGAEADRPGVRDGLGLAARAVLAYLQPRDPAGVPAGRAGHRDVSVRQRHDHGVGRGLPLCPDTTLAAIAVLNMDDAGDVAPAAAMAMLIFVTSAVIRAAYMLITQGYLARSQAWRKR